MKTGYMDGRLNSRVPAIALAAAAALAGSGGVQAQVTRGFIAAHEYALPVDFKPFNIFVQYGTEQHGEKTWNGNGDKTGSDKVDTTVGLSKLVRLWTPESHPNIGLAWEVIVPEVGVRNLTAKTSSGGMGDPITGFAAWYKPAGEWTLGGDFFVQVPVGDKAVGGGNEWNIIGSFFWDAQYGKINYTGNLGYTLPGSLVSGPTPGKTVYTNHRFGYQVSDLIEPYVGLDYQIQASTAANPRNYEYAASAGLMFHIQPNAHLALHYSAGLRGQSTSVSNNLNLRAVYVF
ncbi:MAG: transporter [Burkholderiales bacterium]|nr:transporter [Burkholderiales bacterium]